MDANDVTLALLPMYHSMGCFLAFISLMVGSRIVSIRKFSFTGMLKAIQDHKVYRAYYRDFFSRCIGYIPSDINKYYCCYIQISVMALVPPIAVMLYKIPVEQFNLSSVKVVLCAAAPLSAEVIEAS